jgi:glutamate carboxypeptidase
MNLTGAAYDELDPVLAMARAVRTQAAAEVPTMLRELATLVELESPTFAIEHCDRVARQLAAWLEAHGARSELIPAVNGLYLHARLRGRGRARVALLCHHDTVFPLGTTREWCFSVDGERAHGPGVCDMKGGIVVAMHVLRVLRTRPEQFALVELVSVPDEEERDGPPATIERLRGFDAVLCMECGREDGSIVSERKGGLWTELTAHGRSAHAGTEPDAGANAVAALAQEAVRIQALHRARPGLTVQVTRFAGGVGINTVPGHAELVVDVRAESEADLDWASEQLRPRPVGRVRIERVDLARTPAMERTAPVRALATVACAIGVGLGEPFGQTSTGGSSDAAWSAGIGVPTIDGLGPIGGLDHTPAEYAVIESFASRCAVASGVIKAVNDGLLDAIETPA